MTPLFPISSVIHLPTKKYNKFSRTIVTILENEPSNIPYFPVMWSPHESCPVNVESVGIRMCQKMGSPLNSNALLSSNWLIISFPQKKWPGGIYIYIYIYICSPFSDTPMADPPMAPAFRPACEVWWALGTQMDQFSWPGSMIRLHLPSKSHGKNDETPRVRGSHVLDNMQKRWCRFSYNHQTSDLFNFNHS